MLIQTSCCLVETSQYLLDACWYFLLLAQMAFCAELAQMVLLAQVAQMGIIRNKSQNNSRHECYYWSVNEKNNEGPASCRSCDHELLESNKNATLTMRLQPAAEIVTLNYWSATKL